MTTTITERPILFSGPMVRAILERRKTQTRRPIDRVAGFGRVTEFRQSTTPGYDWQFRCRRRLWQDFRHASLLERCPYGVPGDRLWVRETWAPYWVDVAEEEGEVVYRASYDPSVAGTARDQGATKLLKLPAVTCREWRRDIEQFEVCGERWRPSIHMPRWASRLTLTIQDVRVERLQDISEADVRAEGFDSREEMMRLWGELNAGRGYPSDINPCVWAVTFEVTEAEVSK